MYRADQVHALRKLGKVLVQYFGLGEVTGNITVLPPALHSEIDAEMPVGSCGFPRTGMDVAILDDTGKPRRSGATGEICVRGPGVFAGYHNNPEATAKATAHGWFHTGDLGHMDARGFVYITGRASDMYISGGSNVYPREIEEALLLHPAVAEACVVGMPHEKWGESGVGRAGAGTGDAASRRGVAVAPGRQAGEIQMAARVCLLAGTAEIGLRQSNEARRETSVAEGHMMATSPVEPARITDYHMHVYYDPDTPGPRRAAADVGRGTVPGPHGPLARCAGRAAPDGDVSDRVRARAVSSAGAVRHDEPAWG